MTLLSERLKQSDMIGLSDAEVVNALNTPDTSLQQVPVEFSCRIMAESAVLSGELAILRIVAERGEIPADLTHSAAIPLPTQAIAIIMTMLDAVDRDLTVNPATSIGQIQVMLNNIEAMGLLSATTKADIISKAYRSPSWAEMHGIKVDIFSVGAARAGATAVTFISWQDNGPMPGGSWQEQANLRFQNGTEIGVMFNMMIPNNADLRKAALNQWLSNNANLLS